YRRARGAGLHAAHPPRRRARRSRRVAADAARDRSLQRSGRRARRAGADRVKPLRPRPVPQATAPVGLVQWFRPGEHARVEQVLNDVDALGVRRLRTGLSWADWCTPDGEAWFSWLLPKLAERAALLPCLHYTPPSLGIEPRASAPPRDAADYAAFVGLMLERF